MLVSLVGASAQSKGIDPALLAKAKAGDATAQTKLGYAFDLGQGVPQDYTQAFTWYRKAADQGYAIAQFNLGVLYAEGHGLPQDYAQASTWFRKAADQGYSTAEFSLGFLYATGKGVAHDDTQAAFWYRKAAEQGLADAEYGLGLSYILGTGVPEDKAQAVDWLNKAAAQGNTNAQNLVSMIRKEEENEKAPNLFSELHSYWSTTIRVNTDMDSFWLPNEERTCKTNPDDKGRVTAVACNASGSHRDHNIPVTFWGDIDRNTISDWKCRREKDAFKDEFVCRAIN
jgi:TPR repeat protein